MSEDDHNRIFNRKSEVICTCGWEVKFGYSVAFTLAVLEVKRLLVFALEIFAEWHVIRLAGGFAPIVFTLIDVSLGLPCALITVRTIRRCKLSNFCLKTKQVLRCLLLIIAMCVAMNMMTLASIGYHINVRKETLVNVFNASMQLYVTAASYKYAIDEIQFMLQCCGHSAYTDWFFFDWQKVDYASREEMAEQSRISDEDYRDRGVPFSCCSLHAMEPCMHTEMTDDRTINVNGCAEVISPILLRIVIVAYIMTSTLIITQMLLAFLITRIIYRVLPVRACVVPHVRSSFVPLTIVKASPRIYMPRISSVKECACHKRPNGCQPSTNNVCNKEDWKARQSMFKSSYPLLNRGNCTTWEVAKIKPSAHEEHRISVKRFNSKHTHSNSIR